MSSTVFLNCPKYFLCLKRHIFINIFDEREQVIAERYIIWVEHNFKSSDINHWITRPRSEERISDFLDQKETTLNNLKNSMKLILAKLIQESYCENFLETFKEGRFFRIISKNCITPMPPVYVYRRWEILLKLSDPESGETEQTFVPSPSTGIRPIGHFESPLYNIKAAVII